jgi:hypothetical protein
MSKAESPAWQKWREIIERQQASGLSAAAFCRNHGVADSSFFTWKRKLALSRADVSAAGPADAPATVPTDASASSFPGFVQATISPIRSGAASIQIRLRGGRRLLVRRGFDRDLLAEVVAFFESRS